MQTNNKTPPPIRIIHIDMDAFFAAVEVRDNPGLANKPVVIGAMPDARGVVSTCNYEARKYGIRSAMNIKEAYSLCPHAVFLRPDGRKYAEVSRQIHAIWRDYSDVYELISLDEGYIDVTHTAHLFGGVRQIAADIKRRVYAQTALTCSVGIGYTMMSAKIASEENKPDGMYEILRPGALIRLILDRSVRTIYGIGEKTARTLADVGIKTVRDILMHQTAVVALLGNHGKHILELAKGRDARRLDTSLAQKSIGREHTFMRDISDFLYLSDVLYLIAESLSYDLRAADLTCKTVTLKITYGNMRKITRSQTVGPIRRGGDIYAAAAECFAKIDKLAVRLIGISLSGLSSADYVQISLNDPHNAHKKDALESAMFRLQKKYGRKIISTARALEIKQNPP